MSKAIIGKVVLGFYTPEAPCAVLVVREDIDKFKELFPEAKEAYGIQPATGILWTGSNSFKEDTDE